MTETSEASQAPELCSLLAFQLSRARGVQAPQTVLLVFLSIAAAMLCTAPGRRVAGITGT